MSGSNNNEVKGAFIAGVASSSRKPSIRVYNNRTRYDEWEFLGIDQPGTLGGATGGIGTQGQPTTTGGSGQNPGQGPGTTGGTQNPTTPPPTQIPPPDQPNQL